jgi:hypothetical protein
MSANCGDRQQSPANSQGSRRVQGQTTAINQLWQMDFAYLKITG